jgi:hypothetical protein
MFVRTYSREGWVDTTGALLKGILATVARTAFPPEALYKIVAPTSGSDPGSLSRSIAKWVEAGVVIRVGADQLPLHLYPLTRPTAKSGKKAA